MAVAGDSFVQVTQTAPQTRGQSELRLRITLPKDTAIYGFGCSPSFPPRIQRGLFESGQFLGVWFTLAAVQSTLG